VLSSTSCVSRFWQSAFIGCAVALTVLLMAGSGVTSCGWLHLHSSVMRTHQVVSRTVTWLIWLVDGLLPWRPGFDPKPIHVGFLEDKVTLGQVFLRVLPSMSLHQGSIFIHL